MKTFRFPSLSLFVVYFLKFFSSTRRLDWIKLLKTVAFLFSPGSRRRRRLNTNKAVSNAAAAATSFLHRLQNFKFVASQANPENGKKIEKFLTGTFRKKTPFFAPKMTRLTMESVLEKFKFCWSCRELINTSANCLISN